MRSLLPIPFLLLPACRSGGGLPPGQGDTITLVFTLEKDTVSAGQELGYLAYLDGGAEPVAVDPELTSDKEPLLDFGEGVLVPTVAGLQSITATTEWQGDIYIDTAELQVEPGSPAAVDLVLDDVATRAGDPLGFSVAVQDAWGNAVDPSTAQVTTSSPDVSVVEGKLVSTVPGTYVATATAGQASDDEQFVVLSGEAANLELTLEDQDLELDESTVAHVLITDAWGNPVDEPWVLWTDPAEGVDVNYDALTFRQEGWFTVYASTLDGLLQDSAGPLLIDSTGPDLEVDQPPRGTRTTDSGAVVSGTASDQWAGVGSVQVNGTEASLQEDGSWQAPVDYDFGMNVLETTATDTDGNQTTDTRAVLSGNWTPYGDGIGDGLLARVNEAGFDTIEQMASDFVDTDLLASSISNPVLSDSSESCVDLGWLGEYCFTWYAIDLYVLDPSISSTSLDIDPTSSGTLHTTATIYDPHLDYSVDGVLMEIGYSASGSIDADDITVAMDLTPYVSGGQLGVTASNTAVSENGFSFYLDSWVWDILDFFGLDGTISDLLWDLLVGSLSDMVENEVPSLIDGALSDLQIGQTFEVQGRTFDFDAIPYSVSVDDLGLTLGLETWFTTDTWVSPFAADPGSLTWPYTPPTFASATPAMELGISEDFLNQVMLAFWGGGLLDMQVTDQDLGLDVDQLQLFLPGISALTVSTTAWLPPVVVPGTGGGLLDLQLGDLELSLYDGQVDESNLFLRAYVSAVADLDLTTTSADTLQASLGDLDMYFDVVEPEGRYAQDTEAFLGELVPLLLPALTDTLAEVQIPDLSGFTLSGVTVSLDGPESGYVVAGGDLVAN